MSDMIERGIFVNQKFADSKVEEDDLIVFLHAQRTAGTSFREDVLTETLTVNQIYAFQYCNDWKHWGDVDDDSLEGFRAFVGHSDYCINNVSRDLYFITLLRHPVFRIFSLYDYSMNYDYTSFHELAVKHEIKDFYRKVITISSHRFAYFSNAMCRRISGHPSFETAIKIIEERFLAVGYCGLMPMFADWFADKLEVPRQDLKTIGPDCERYSQNLQDSELVELILRYNEEDEKLFRHMNKQYFGLPEDNYPWSIKIDRLQDDASEVKPISIIKWEEVEDCQSYRLLIRDKQIGAIEKIVVEKNIFELDWSKYGMESELIYRIQNRTKEDWMDMGEYRKLEPSPEIIESLMSDEDRGMIVKLRWEPVQEAEEYRVIIRDETSVISKRCTSFTTMRFNWKNRDTNQRYVYRTQYLLNGEWAPIHPRYLEISIPVSVALKNMEMMNRRIA